MARLTKGATFQVTGINTTGDWYQVQSSDFSGSGWVLAAATVVTGDVKSLSVVKVGVITPTQPATQPLTTTKVLSPTVIASSTVASAVTSVPTTGTPTAVLQRERMNVRSGPGTNYGVVTSLALGTHLEILALNPAGDWYQVKVPGQDEAGWILARLTSTTGTVGDLPHLTAEQLPAPPVVESAPAAQTAPVAAQATSAPAAVVANAPPPAGGGFFAFGIQANMWQGDKQGSAAAVRDLGFTWVKQQVRWEFAENEQGAVNWSEMDDILNVMNGNGIQVLFSVVTAPQWSRPDKAGTGGPPNDFNAYADFVGKIAGRYCGRLGAIEVWNEQNLQREWEGFSLDPASYMDLLRRSYAAIKSACPAVLVISGATTPTGNSPIALDDIDYLRGMYNNGLARYSDGVGVHPSGFGIPPTVTIQDYQQGRYTPPPSHFDHRSFYFRSTMEESRAVMVQFGDTNKRLWPTEFGWASTVSPYPGYEYAGYVSEAQQADYIVTAFRQMQAWGWVGVPFLWNLNYNEGEMSQFHVAGRSAYEALKGLTR